MDIKLEQYKFFCTAAESPSFSEAAKKLYITQSAISQQIRALESELGVTLFVRGKKGTKLTTHGELLYVYSKRALSEFENVESLFTRMRSLNEGSLRIGAGDTITRHFLLSVLERFHYEYPGIKIEIVNRVTNETLNKLKSGQIDIAFINLPVDSNSHHDLVIREIGDLHDVFIAGKNYRHLENKTLSRNDIASLPLAMLEPKSNSRKAVDKYFESYNIQLNPEFELGSYDLLFDFAKRNLGIACITKEFAVSYEDNDIFELTTDFELPKRSIGICTLKNLDVSPAVIKLIEMIEDNYL